MNIKGVTFLTVLFLGSVLSQASSAEEARDASAAIRSQLKRYEQALNSSNVESVMSLYANDGVFMPQHSLPSVGESAVRKAYVKVFKAITLDINFQIDEVVQLSPQWAFARTRSEGFVTINANGVKSPEANQELFLFHKQEDGDWNIARYIFSTTNPRQQ